MTDANEPELAWWPSVAPVWGLTAIAVAVALLASTGNDRWGALVMVFVGGVLVTFLAQLLTRTPHGFLHRARLSVFGVFLLVALGSAIGLLAR